MTFIPVLRRLPIVFQPATIETWEARLLGAVSKAVPGGVGYVSEQDFKLHEQFRSNRYVGTGIQIRMAPKENLAALVYCFRGGPARRAGGLVGDLIVKVDGVNMKGCSLSEVVQRLRGAEGTSVSMVVRQPGAKETRTLDMVRSVVPFTTVTGYRRANAEEWTYRVDPVAPIGYVHIEAIRSSTLHELRQAERRLQADGCRVLVLDLRFFAGSEPEGDHEAALLADALLDRGVMWRVRKSQGETQDLRADEDCLFRHWPLAVLVDGTAGPRGGNGAALIAAALQDNQRATLVGNPLRAETYVLRHIHLPEQQGVIHLATAHLERARPTSAEAHLQVRPDHHVSLTAKGRLAWGTWRNDLSIERHLDAKPPADPQLDKAVEVLQAALQSAPPPVKTP